MSKKKEINVLALENVWMDDRVIDRPVPATQILTIFKFKFLLNDEKY